MLLNQTEVAVNEKLEKVIITIDSCTETYIGDNESGYEYSSGETTETSSETEARLQLGLQCILFWMLKFSWNYIVLNEIRWHLIKSL